MVGVVRTSQAVKIKPSCVNHHAVCRLIRPFILHLTTASCRRANEIRQTVVVEMRVEQKTQRCRKCVHGPTRRHETRKLPWSEAASQAWWLLAGPATRNVPDCNDTVVQNLEELDVVEICAPRQKDDTGRFVSETYHNLCSEPAARFKRSIHIHLGLHSQARRKSYRRGWTT